MRTYLVAALVVAVVACLTRGVSAGGYGYGHKTHTVHRPITPARYAYRYYRQPVVLGGQAGFTQRYLSGFNSGRISGYSGGYYNQSGGSSGIIWLIIIAVILFILLSDK